MEEIYKNYETETNSEENIGEPNYIPNEVTSETALKPEKKSSGGAGKFFKKAAAITMSALLFGAVAGGAIYGSNYILSKVDKTNTSQSQTTSTTKKSNPVDTKLTKASDGDSSKSQVNLNSTGENLDVSKIVENCMPSIVAITNVGVSEVRTFWGTYQQPSQSAGSGVIIAKTETELLILTNYHVVSGSNELTVVFSFDENSEEPEAVQSYLKGYDASLDLAVIAIPIDDLSDEILSSISVAVVGESDDLELGEQVVAIGNALGYGQSVTTGIVSALDRVVTLEGTNGEKISNKYIQTDAAINPGNSGGALLNMKGELIGINSAKVSNSAVEGMGYAIPISAVYDDIEQMMNEKTQIKLSDEERGYLGISGEGLDETTAARYHVPQGVYVSEAYEGYAADIAGIQKGDIITKVNDKEVTTMEELKAEVGNYAAGEKITVTYIRYSDESRSYEEDEAEVTLDDYEKFKEVLEKTEEENKKKSGSGSYGDEDIWNYFYNY